MHTSGSSVSKDELLALAAKIRIHAAIQHLHQYLTTPLHPQKLKTTPAHHLQVTAQRLQKVSDDVMMNDSDKAFILKCLQDCWCICNIGTWWQWLGKKNKTKKPGKTFCMSHFLTLVTRKLYHLKKKTFHVLAPECQHVNILIYRDNPYSMLGWISIFSFLRPDLPLF